MILGVVVGEPCPNTLPQHVADDKVIFQKPRFKIEGKCNFILFLSETEI